MPVVVQHETPEHPYSLVRLLPDGSGHVSGVLPYEDDGSLADDPARAVDRVLTVLADRLAAVGLGLEHVVRTTVYLTDIAWRDAVNAAWHAAFTAPRPARTAVQVAALPAGARIEVDAIVHRDAPGTPGSPGPGASPR